MTAEKAGFIEDYEKRKSDVISNINEELRDALRLGIDFTESPSKKLSVIDSWIVKKKRLNDLKKVLYNIDHNEHNKASYYDHKIERYAKYILRANGTVNTDQGQPIFTEVPEKYFKEDEKLKEVIAVLGDYRDKRDNFDTIKKQDAIFEEKGDIGRSLFNPFVLIKGFGQKPGMDSDDDQELLETESQELAEAEAAFKKAAKDLMRTFKEALTADQEFLRN